MDFFAFINQEVLGALSRHCPRAISTYLQCINRADKNGKVFFSEETISIDMSESCTKFRNDLKALARENLLEWHPFNGGVAVTLFWPEDQDE
jgi:hypothetical protein